MQVFGITQVNFDNKTVKIGFSIDKCQIGYIRLLLADQRADSPQHARIVGDGHVEADGMHRRMGAGMPAQIDPAVRLLLEFGQGGAIYGMHDHALPAIGDTDDAFAGNRLAAIGPPVGLIGGQADHRAVGIDDLGRLGGLLKLWLTDDPRTARFGDATILALLGRIEATQDEMSRLMKSVVQPRAEP